MADLIITEKYLKENGLVNDNTSMKVITPMIVLVQDLYIHPILGSDLYNQIQTQINTSAVSSDSQTLLDRYVLPCILWYTLCEATPAMKYRYMNKGVMVKNSENSQPADLQEIKWLMDKWRNNAEVYAQRTTNFLKANTTTYPLYIANTDCDDIRPNKNNYQSSIFLDDNSEDCEGYYS
jgi:hypothetical protein